MSMIRSDPLAPRKFFLPQRTAHNIGDADVNQESQHLIGQEQPQQAQTARGASARFGSRTAYSGPASAGDITVGSGRAGSAGSSVPASARDTTLGSAGSSVPASARDTSLGSAGSSVPASARDTSLGSAGSSVPASARDTSLGSAGSSVPASARDTSLGSAGSSVPASARDTSLGFAGSSVPASARDTSLGSGRAGDVTAGESSSGDSSLGSRSSGYVTAESGETTLVEIERIWRIRRKGDDLPKKTTGNWEFINFAEDYWTKKAKVSAGRLDAYRTNLASSTNQLIQLIGLYIVFQGVLLTACVQSARLTCKYFWFPFALNIIATLCAISGVLSKFKEIIGFEDLEDEFNQEHKHTVSQLADLKHKLVEYDFKETIPDLPARRYKWVKPLIVICAILGFAGVALYLMNRVMCQESAKAPSPSPS